MSLPPPPGFALENQSEVSQVIGFTRGGAFGVAGTLGPQEIPFTRETFTAGCAAMLYGDRKEEVLSWWRFCRWIAAIRKAMGGE